MGLFHLTVLLSFVGLEAHFYHCISRGSLVQVDMSTLPQPMELFPWQPQLACEGYSGLPLGNSA